VPVIPVAALGVLLLGSMLALLNLRARPQHTDAGDGALSVWHLHDRLAGGHARSVVAGRHRAR
jgi:hypothetical protein